MKIRLVNFRCYEDETFDFGDGKLALLSGPSGKGKSTILMGIYFALFGTGSKITACGKSSCMVELEFDGMKIVRTKRPNRVVVNEVYEDESAQEIINEKFGDTFDVTGYISQNALNSFILLSPIDKLSFLEKFAFRDVDLGKIKGRCKANITKCHDEFLGILSQLDMAKCVLEEMVPPVEVKFPLKCKSSQKENEIKNENIRFKNCNTLIRRSEKKIANTKYEINDLKVLEAMLQSRKETCEELVEKLADLDIEIDNNIYEGDEELERYEKKLKTILSRKHLHVLEEQLENDQSKLKEMKKNEEKSIQDELESINNVLWQEYTRDELKNTIQELKSCLCDLEKVEQLKKEVKRCTVNLDIHNKHKTEFEQQTGELEEKQRLHDKLVTQQELYSCPKCMSKLRLLNEELILSEEFVEGEIEANLDTLKEEIQSLKCNIVKLQRVIPAEEDKIARKTYIETEITKILLVYEDIPKIVEVKEDLEYLREYQARQVEIEKKKKELEKYIETEKFSGSYIAFKHSIEKLERNIEKLREQIGDEEHNIDEEELRQKIVEQKLIRDKIIDLEEHRDKMKEKINRYKYIIDKANKKHIDKYGNINNKDELEKIIEYEQTKIEEQEKKRVNHEKNLKQIESWKQYQENLEKYQTWVDKVDDLVKKEKESRNKYAASTALKDKILEAESIAMVNIIDKINTHASLYLECFFSEHPISVQLQPFKETKKSTKPKINIAIEYKGMEAELNMLSGGELSRVILAYTLALAEIFNTPLLLLDECTASLDQELTGTVFDAIRDNFNGKLTLIIAHQVVTGTFDKVIQLGKVKE